MRIVLIFFIMMYLHVTFRHFRFLYITKRLSVLCFKSSTWSNTCKCVHCLWKIKQLQHLMTNYILQLKSRYVAWFLLYWHAFPVPYATDCCKTYCFLSGCYLVLTANMTWQMPQQRTCMISDLLVIRHF